MTRTIAATAATACLAATVLAACSTGVDDRDCQPFGSAVVRAVGPDGRTWTARTAATEDPPTVSGGYVLVRHSCGWTALDADDGQVAGTGPEDEVFGIAGGLVFTRDVENDSIDGKPLLQDESSGGGVSFTSTSVQHAIVVDDRLYIYGSSGLTQYAGHASRRWEAVLPVMRNPTLTPVGATLVVTSSEGSVYGLDVLTGHLRWRVLAPTLESSMTLRARPHGARAVVVTVWDGDGGDGTAFVLDAATGERLDRTAAPEPIDLPLAATGEGWRVTIESEDVPHVIHG